jgi:hypothetical protein
MSRPGRMPRSGTKGKSSSPYAGAHVEDASFWRMYCQSCSDNRFAQKWMLEQTAERRSPIYPRSTLDKRIQLDRESAGETLVPR